MSNSRAAQNLLMGNVPLSLSRSLSRRRSEKQVVIHPQVVGAFRGAAINRTALPFPAMNELQ
jgi:hypothetical protein